MRILEKIGLLSVILLLAFVFAPKKKIKVYLIGDSTMSIKQTGAYPETGWGMPFVYFFDSTVTVDNRAMNGRSTRTFMEENRWKPVVDSVKEGDYVFIQFGHNDEVSTKKSYTTENEFEANLLKYLSDTKNKKATPILVTPVARRKFDSLGNVVGTHEVYSEIVRKVAKKNNTLLIDLDRKSQELYQKAGIETSKLFFLHLQAGEHPNYPDGKVDDTHFSELGARKIAQLVLAEIRNLNLELTERIVKKEEKK
jgi:lysophospholipase L1-like esterase